MRVSLLYVIRCYLHIQMYTFVIVNLLITAASSPEPSIRVEKNPAPLYHTE